MPVHINPNDPDCKKAAAEILRRHNEGQPEANITTAVRDFLTETRLVKPEHIVEENPPAEGSRRAVDLTALDTFIEFKRRIGTTGGFNPDPKNVDQLDSSIELHVEVSEAGKTDAAGAAKQLKRLRQERYRVTVTIARRELRKWLRESNEGQAVEDAVGRLLEAKRR